MLISCTSPVEGKFVNQMGTQLYSQVYSKAIHNQIEYAAVFSLYQSCSFHLAACSSCVMYKIQTLVDFISLLTTISVPFGYKIKRLHSLPQTSTCGDLIVLDSAKVKWQAVSAVAS